ncbi:MAG: type II secretion system F family protein [Candidatus Saganbacteria bacterium]|nr:type II secretion system F family protein [Candidatus Saganbacteria bacterium]
MPKKCLSKRDTARFCSQLRLLLSSGVPLLQALQIVRRLSGWPRLEQVCSAVSEGRSLSAASEGFLPVVALTSLRGAEACGGMEEVLLRLSLHFEARADVEDKIKSALIYPCFVLLICLLTVCLLVFLVLPGFKTFFIDLNADLPWLTRMMLWLGEAAANNWYWPLGLFGCLVVAMPRFGPNNRLRQACQALASRSRTYCRSQASSLFFSLATLLEGGVAISEALRTSASAAACPIFAKRINFLKDRVEAGEKLSTALAEDRLFNGSAVQMVLVGEATGQLAVMLRAAAEVYDRERELMVKRLLSLLEPGLTLFVGLIAGVVVLAMFLPLVNMISSLQ